MVCREPSTATFQSSAALSVQRKIICLLRKTCAFDETDQRRTSWFLRPPNQLFMLLIVNSLGAVCSLYDILFNHCDNPTYWVALLAAVGSETQNISDVVKGECK